MHHMVLIFVHHISEAVIIPSILLEEIHVVFLDAMMCFFMEKEEVKSSNEVVTGELIPLSDAYDKDVEYIYQG